MNYVSEFCNHESDDHGFTYEEAMRKKFAVDEAHAVGTQASCWNPAEIVVDPFRKDGYKVIIKSK